MKIELYVSTTDKNRLNKTSFLSLVGEYEGYLRAPSSVIAPTITLELSISGNPLIVDEDDELLIDEDDNEISTEEYRITDANYMYIPEFGRYYFIRDITIGVTGLYVISSRVDVLMSYKDQILNLECYIERNEYAFDPSLEDNLLPLQFRKFQDEVIPDDGDFVNTHFDAGTFVNQTRVVMGVATDNYPGYIPDITYNGFGSGLPQIEPETFSSYRSSMFYAMTKEMFGKISNALLTDDAKMSFVKSVVVLPFDPKSSFSTNKYIYFGLSNDLNNLMLLEDGHNASGYPVQAFSGYRVIADFTLDVDSVQDFMKYPPYTHYEIFVPFYGFVNLDLSFYLRDRLIVFYAINYEDGSATAFIYNYTRRKMLWSAPCQVGVLLNLSTTNAKENTTQKNANLLNLAVGSVGSAISIGAGVATYNPMAVAGGALGAVKSVTSFVNSNAMLFDRAQTGNSGSTSGLFNYLKVHVRRTYQIPNIAGDSLTKFAHACGRPTREMYALRNLQGFTIAQSMHLEGITAYSGELDEIQTLFSQGVLL